MNYGRVPHPYDLTMGCLTAAGGVLLWNMVTVLQVICAYTCLTQYAGSLNLDGQNELMRQEVFMFRKEESRISPTHKLQYLNMMSSIVFGSIELGVRRLTQNTLGPLRSEEHTSELQS